VEHVQGTWSIKSSNLRLRFDIIFHLAASLSSKAEIATEEAHRINVEGTMQLLMLAAYRSEKYKKEVKFLFPSSIAVYGFSDLAPSMPPGVSRKINGTPRTPCMVAINCIARSLACTTAASTASATSTATAVMCDFRAIRFPGLISAFTLPSGVPATTARICCMPPRKAPICLFRPAGYPDLLHGHAGCHQSLLMLAEARARN